MTRPYLTELEAWAKIRRAFERYDQTGVPSPYSRTGLSIAVSKLQLNKYICSDVELVMKRRIHRDWALAQRRMPEDHAHAAARVRRCLEYEREVMDELVAAKLGWTKDQVHSARLLPALLKE